jgi:putative peptidoglycan lipid II flippase
MSEHRSVLKSTWMISALTVVSRIFGYIRDSQITSLLGTGALADAYTVAFRIPNALRRLVGEGAVSASFIPVFSKYLKEEKRSEAWEFVNAMVSAALVFLTIITILGIVFSPQVVQFFVSGEFESDLEKFEVTTALNRIMFPYIAFVSLAAISMGVLNSFSRFAAPAFAPVMLNISIIILSFFSGFFSNPAKALAIGVVVGGVLQLAIQIPSLLRTGWHFRWLWNLANPGVRQVAKLMGPRLFGIGIVQIDLIVGLQFATRMAVGSPMALSTADRVMELVLGGYAIALSTAILPLLSRQAAGNNIGEMKSTIAFSLRMVLFITLPATVGLILLHVPIIQVLFERGEFTADSTAMTSWSLLFFAVGLSAFAMMKIIIQAFYALHDTRTPVMVAAASLLVSIGLNFIFFRPLQNGGPALATSLAAVFDTIVLLSIFRKRHGRLDLRSVVAAAMKFLGAAAVMAVVISYMIDYANLFGGDRIHKAMGLGFTIALATASYFGTAWLLRVGELRDVLGMFSRRSAR